MFATIHYENNKTLLEVSEQELLDIEEYCIIHSIEYHVKDRIYKINDTNSLQRYPMGMLVQIDNEKIFSYLLLKYQK